MADIMSVQRTALAFAAKDEAGLELLIGLQDRAIEANPMLAEDPTLAPVYDPHMGLLDDLKALGRRIAVRWSKELHGVVCEARNQEERDKILTALKLDEAAVIIAVAAALTAMTVPAPIAAALAPLIVRRFIWPARDELCTAWREALTG